MESAIPSFECGREALRALEALGGLGRHDGFSAQGRFIWAVESDDEAEQANADGVVSIYCAIVGALLACAPEELQQTIRASMSSSKVPRPPPTAEQVRARVAMQRRAVSVLLSALEGSSNTAALDAISLVAGGRTTTRLGLKGWMAKAPSRSKVKVGTGRGLGGAKEPTKAVWLVNRRDLRSRAQKMLSESDTSEMKGAILVDGEARDGMGATTSMSLFSAWRMSQEDARVARKPTLAEHALLNSLLHEHEGKPACIGAARAEDSLEDVVLVLECLESDHGADGAEVLRKIVKAVELSLSEGMEDGDAAQVFQVLPLAKALKASPDMVELAAEWLALRPELGTLQQGTSIDSAAGRGQQGKVKARRIPARPKGY